MTTPEIAEARRLAEELANTREELAELRREHDQRGGMLELTRMARDEVADELERLRAQVASLSREAWTWSKALEAQLAQSKPAQETAAAQVAPDGWTVRDRSDLEPGAIDVQGPGWARTILTRDGGDRMLYALALAIALAPAPAQQADPKRELLERIVDGATPGEGGLTASLRAVAADALAQQAGQAPAPEQGSWVSADDVQRLARDLDVAINGEAGAAPAPQLCDVVAQAVGVMAARRADFPIVARWTGGAKDAGPRARVWVQFEDGGTEVEFAPAGQAPAVPHGKEQQEKTELPPRYMLAKLQMVMPLFQEARDALTALTEQRRKLRGISPTLADRMDEAGTFSLDDWTAMSGKES